VSAPASLLAIVESAVGVELFTLKFQPLIPIKPVSCPLRVKSLLTVPDPHSTFCSPTVRNATTPMKTMQIVHNAHFSL
jgi:hypothetical protein